MSIESSCSASPLILCADDYALAPGVSRGILALVEAGRLSAVGCMSVSPFWPEHAVWLRRLVDSLESRSAEGADIGRSAEGADVGLHLTLTDHYPLGPTPAFVGPDGRFPPLGRLLLRASRGVDAEDAAQIRAEVERQVAAFAAAFGRPPDFIDGHQHVHLLPFARSAVLAAARACGAYVRNCCDSPFAIVRRRIAAPKALFISALGQPLRREARRCGVRMNRRFCGVYDFSGKISFDALFERFLDDGLDRTQASARAGSVYERGGDDSQLMMVHPGFPDDILRRLDPVTDQRQIEFDFLAGATFLQVLARRRRRLARFKPLLFSDTL